MTATQLQVRRGTASQIALFTPALAELIIDTTNKRLIIGDGQTLGGIPLARFDDLVSSVEPGTVVDYAGATAPSGYLMCYGQNVSRSTYADLFDAIGTTYGIGDGTTTFGLPDCRGRVVAGKDNMGGSSADRLTNQSGGLNGDTLGATGGAETHTLTSGQVPENGTGTPAGPSGEFSVPVPAVTHGGAAASAHNNVQPTIIFNKMIKY